MDGWMDRSEEEGWRKGGQVQVQVQVTTKT